MKNITNIIDQLNPYAARDIHRVSDNSKTALESVLPVGTVICIKREYSAEQMEVITAQQQKLYDKTKAVDVFHHFTVTEYRQVDGEWIPMVEDLPVEGCLPRRGSLVYWFPQFIQEWIEDWTNKAKYHPYYHVPKFTVWKCSYPTVEVDNAS